MRAGKCPFEISHLKVAAHCHIAVPHDVTEQFFRQTAPFVVPTRSEQTEYLLGSADDYRI